MGRNLINLYNDLTNNTSYNLSLNTDNFTLTNGSSQGYARYFIRGKFIYFSLYLFFKNDTSGSLWIYEVTKNNISSISLMNSDFPILARIKNSPAMVTVYGNGGISILTAQDNNIHAGDILKVYFVTCLK